MIGLGDRLVSGHVRPAGVPLGGRGWSRQVAYKAPGRWWEGSGSRRDHHRKIITVGDHVGANPVDRGKPGSKLHLVCEGGGLPLTAAVTAANVGDVTMLQAMVDDIPPIRTPSGQRRTRPGKLDADKTSHAVRRQAGAGHSSR